MSGSAPSDRTDDDRDAQAVLTVDLDALGANWRALAARAAPAECAAAVKADAYGIGIAAAVPALARAGCLTFFVAHAAEGRRARAALDAAGMGGRIFVLNGFHPEAAGFDAYQAHGLDAVIGSAEELRAWTEAREAAGAAGAVGAVECGPAGASLPEAALHVDTGMNRLGFPVEDARFLSQGELQAAGIRLAMSHLVSAEDPADPVNARQVAAFDHARERALRALPASLANSSGVFLPGRPAYDLVRPGYALYGGNPQPGRPNPMRPVVRLDARVLQLRAVPAGATAGYNARWTAERPSRLATVALGYADGVPIGGSGIAGREAGRGVEVYAGGVPCPLVGRISMDLSIADVTHLPAGALKAGDTVEWLGPHADVDALAARCGTIGYELLVNLGRRHRRHYIGNGMGTA